MLVAAQGHLGRMGGAVDDVDVVVGAGDGHALARMGQGHAANSLHRPVVVGVGDDVPDVNLVISLTDGPARDILRAIWAVARH